jgi:MFS family permease
MQCLSNSALGTTGDAGETHFHVTSLQYLLSNTGFFLSLAVGPMFLAPISESYGRRPIFLVTLTIYSLLFVPAALVRQFTAWAVVRALSGLSASVVNTMVSGTITDLYGNRDVGRIMNLYVFSLFAGQVSASRLRTQYSCMNLACKQSVSPVLLAWMTAYIAYPWIWAVSVGNMSCRPLPLYSCSTNLLQSFKAFSPRSGRHATLSWGKRLGWQA